MEAEMVDYADRNWDSCREPGQECHAQYHFSDVALERNRYQPGVTGTNGHDIEHAIQAAIMVLEGKAAPYPFSISDPKEALLMLAHLVGDIHQPLHVGSIYLDNSGQQVDPDHGVYDPATFTRGGNFLFHGSQKLHAEWDSVGSYPTPSTFSILLKGARNVPLTSGAMESWPNQWATETIGQAQVAFSGMTFASAGAHKWTLVEPSGYASRRSRRLSAPDLASRRF